MGTRICWLGYVCSSFCSSSGKWINLTSFGGCGLDIQRSGYAFLESLHPTQKVYFTREVVGSRPPKQLLPASKVPQERILVLLDCNSNIFIEGDLIEFKIGSWGSIDGLETDMGIPTEHNEEDNDPHILVQQSYPQDLPRRGSTDLSYLTPALFPETIREEPGVQETPSVKSRFMNPDSATVTLPRALAREDTFDKLTPRRKKSLFPSTGTDQLPVMNDMDLSTSEDEDEAVQSSRFFKPTPAEPNSIESTADEELPQVSTGGMIASTTSTVLLPRWPDSVKENREPGAEDMWRQFSGAPMITSFTAGSVGVSRDSSPAVEGESSRKPNSGKDSDMSAKPMKQGVPEGFLYEEHKKDVTPKQTYGKNRRTPRAKPKEKTIEMDERIELAISEDGLKQGRRGRSTKGGNGRIIGGGQEIDESEISSSIRVHQEQDDTIMETADEEGQDIAPPARTQGRRGRMIVQSQPDGTAATAEVGLGSGGSPRRKRIPSPGIEGSELDVVEKEAGLAPTPKPARPRRGTIKLPGTSEAFLSAAPATTKPTRSARKRRRALEAAGADQEPLAGDGDIDSSAESVICVTQEPRSKRAKTTPPKKPAAKTPRGKRGGKGVTPTPPPDNTERPLGDTQYTFPDVSQTQAMDSVEAKAPIRTPKTNKKKTTSSTKKTSISPYAKNKKEPTEEGDRLEAKEVDGAGEEKTKTRDQYDGDSPKIVFSNSGLDGKKVRTFHP